MNVFKEITMSDVDLGLWKVKNNKDCPLPDGEVIKRLWS